MAKVKTNDKKKKEKKDKKQKANFPKKTAMVLDDNGDAVSALNADGLLTGTPVTVMDGDTVVHQGFDLRKHNPLKKGDFVDIATYLLHLAWVARQKAAKLITSAEEKEKKAERIRKFGDEATRKKAMKISRMREQLAALEKQLEEEGIEVDDL